MHRFVFLLIGTTLITGSLSLMLPKNNVKFVLQRLEIMEVNPDLLKVSARVDKINKTDYALNANFTLLKDMPEMILKLDVFALFSNEYKPMPLTISKNMCEVYKHEYKWVEEEITKDSKIPERCPIKKGDFYIRNFIPDTRKFPFISPWNNVKLRIHYYEIQNKKTVINFNVYARQSK